MADVIPGAVLHMASDTDGGSHEMLPTTKRNHALANRARNFHEHSVLIRGNNKKWGGMVAAQRCDVPCFLTNDQDAKLEKRYLYRPKSC
jgi:hypothetical protein